MPKKIFIIDGHAQVYRAFYAVEGLTSPDGQPTGAVFGFTRMLLDSIKNHCPDYLAVAFDSPGKTFRHEQYTEYKATRKPMPPELCSQIPIIMEMLAAFKVKTYSKDKFEADDIIGTLACQAVKKDLDVVIVSSDKDLCQLLTPRISMYDPRKDELITNSSYTQNKQIRPEQLPDVFALWGDASDNIPGVPGIGQKGSAELILKYGSLANLLEHADEIKGKRGENLRNNRELALLSKQLATINLNTPVEFISDDCLRREPDNEQLNRLYSSLGFFSMLKEKRTTSTANTETRNYMLINTDTLFKDFISKLSCQESIAVDVETTSLDPMQARLVGISFAWKSKEAYYLPFRGPENENILSEKHLQELRPYLENPKIDKTGHNLKYDILVLKNAGIELQGITFDSILASHLLAGHLRRHSLDNCAERLLGLQTIHIDTLIGKGKKQISMSEVELAKITEYAAEDADIALRLRQNLEAKIAEQKLTKLFHELELPLAQVLADIQYHGIRIDTEKLRLMSEDMEKQLERLQSEIYFLAGREFNIASPRQLAEILFKELGFRAIRKTKTGLSTDEKVLRELALEPHPKQILPKLLLDYRGYSKLKNTYLDALPLLVNATSGRIHTTFHQTGTTTGRLSSSNPNLQNIPVRSADGRGIRAAFLPQEGWQLIAADYSQIELRILAHLSQDPALMSAFKENKDIHLTVAAQVFSLPEAEVNEAQRRAAKAVNFGLLYGQSTFGLSQTTNMNRSEAQEFIDKYFQKYPGVKSFFTEQIAMAIENGYAITILGRKRTIPELAATNKTRRLHGERMAINTIVQGSAADLIKKAMLNIHKRLQQEKFQARMLLQIHDELVLESPANEVKSVVELLRNEMESALELTVPLLVDIKQGENWLETK